MFPSSKFASKMGIGSADHPDVAADTTANMKPLTNISGCVSTCLNDGLFYRKISKLHRPERESQADGGFSLSDCRVGSGVSPIADFHGGRFSG